MQPVNWVCLYDWNLLYAGTVVFKYKTSIWRYNVASFIRISAFLLDFYELCIVSISRSLRNVSNCELAVDIKLHALLCGSSSRLYVTFKDMTLFFFLFFSSWTSWPLKMGPIRCPETSVKYCHSTLRNIPEERRPQDQVSVKHKILMVSRINLFGFWWKYLFYVRKFIIMTVTRFYACYCFCSFHCRSYS